MEVNFLHEPSKELDGSKHCTSNNNNNNNNRNSNKVVDWL